MYSDNSTRFNNILSTNFVEYFDSLGQVVTEDQKMLKRAIISFIDQQSLITNVADLCHVVNLGVLTADHLAHWFTLVEIDHGKMLSQGRYSCMCSDVLHYLPQMYNYVMSRSVIYTSLTDMSGIKRIVSIHQQQHADGGKMETRNMRCHLSSYGFYCVRVSDDPP